MGKTVTIFCKNTGRTHRVPLGFNLEEVYELLEIKMPHGVTSAKVNNKVEELHFALFNDKDIEFLDVTSPSGMRTYTRSLFFVLYKAVHDLYPKGRLRIDTPVSNGYYCRLDGEFDVDVIRRRMQEIVDADLPFHRVTCHTSEAIALFREHGLENKAKLLEGLGSLYTNYYTLDDVADYFYGSLLIRTGQIRLFDVVPYGDGLLLRLPDPENPEQLRPMVEQSKMFDVFREQHRWQEILGVSTIGELNKANDLGLTNQLINVTEALQEKKISQLADRIAANGDTANKIGTYALAVLAKYHHIPFYVAAPDSTFDPTLASGDQIVIEERSGDEVVLVKGKRIAPEGVKTRHPAFDVTPHSLITGIITPSGILRPKA